MKILVGSENNLKINAVIKAFNNVFIDEIIECLGINVSSNVSDMPKSRDETKTGAINRATFLSINYDADYYIGLEGGLEDINDETYVTDFVCIIDKNKQISLGSSGIHKLPNAILNLINQGLELGEADDIVFKKTDSKKVNGSIGLLTNNLITRFDTFVLSTTRALIPYINKDLY